MSWSVRDLARMIAGMQAARDQLDEGLSAAIAAYETGEYQRSADVAIHTARAVTDSLAHGAGMPPPNRAARRARKARPRISGGSLPPGKQPKPPPHQRRGGAT